MILYHGTNIDFKTIDLSQCIPFKDFGKGFYLTDLRDQAGALAQKKSMLFGGSPIIYGPIANDGVAYLLGRYEEGSINLDELAKELEFKDLNNQYCFGTQQAIDLLKRYE